MQRSITEEDTKREEAPDREPGTDRCTLCIIWIPSRGGQVATLEERPDRWVPTITAGYFFITGLFGVQLPTVAALTENHACWNESQDHDVVADHDHRRKNAKSSNRHYW